MLNNAWCGVQWLAFCNGSVLSLNEFTQLTVPFKHIEFVIRLYFKHIQKQKSHRRPQHKSNHTPSRNLRANTPTISRQRHSQLIAIMIIIRNPRRRPLSNKPTNPHRHHLSLRPTLNNLHTNTPIHIPKPTNPNPARPSINTNPHSTRSHMPAPVCKRPEALTGVRAV
jgi:hypothetical protein